MILAILIPGTKRSDKISGIMNGMLIGLVVYVSCLYSAAQQSAVTQWLHDEELPRLPFGENVCSVIW